MSPTNEEALFALAVAKPAAERIAWLDRECGRDAALRARLHALLAAHEQPDTLLATQPESARPTLKLDLVDKANALTEKANAQGALHFIQEDVLSQANPGFQPDRDLKVRTLLDRVGDRLDRAVGRPPLVEASIRQTRPSCPSCRVAKETGRVPAGCQSDGEAAAIDPNRKETLLAPGWMVSDGHEAQSLNVLKVTAIERGHFAPTHSRRGRNDQVVVTGHLPGGFQFRPDAGVFAGDLRGVINDGKLGENDFEVSQSSCSIVAGGALHAVPQFRHRDGSDFKLLLRLASQPTGQIKASFLAADDDVGVEDYRHRSSGGDNAARESRRSSAQARASSVESATPVSARARSAPVQRGDSAGIKRAMGFVASSTTNVVCSRRARRAHSVKLEPAFSSEMEVSFMVGTYLSPARPAKLGELIN